MFGILIYFAATVLQDNSSPQTANRKRRSSLGKRKSVEPPARQVGPGDDLRCLMKSTSQGGIMHKLQPLIVPELIARVGMRWWNAASSKVAASVVRNAVIQSNLGSFGALFDELYEADTSSLSKLLQKLRTSHGHAARDHHGRMAILIARLFQTTYDPRINFVKEKVFGVKDGASILSPDHPVMLHLNNLRPKGTRLPCFCLDAVLALMLVDPLCRWEYTCTFRNG